MPTQIERIAKIEEFKSHHSRLFWSAVTGAIVWMGYLTVVSNGYKGDIQAIKQKLADGGLGQIVSALQHPSSPQQLAANLGLVSAQVKVARAEGKAPDPVKVGKLTSAVEATAISNPNLPEVWQAVSQLANARASLVSAVLSLPAELPPCDLDKDLPVSVKQPGNTYSVEYRFQRCTLSLDRLPRTLGRIRVRPDGTLLTNINPDASPIDAIPTIVLTDGALVYRGEAKPPYAIRLVLHNCRLLFDVNSVPDSWGQNMLLAALKSAETGLIQTGALPLG